ncbi:MAG TPA: aminotransferase class V-fold PLP-dependent enzyme [Longimicrobiales bacterium]|nr:aminotransferase class V-fold PLP-dependent enzyme [Longimicrobiales bacterium]
MTTPLTCQREQFSLPRHVHYLNCAYMGPLSLAVQQAGIAGVMRKADPSRIAAADFFTQSNEARALFAALINADDPQRIALIPSASYGIATAARNLKCAAGQNIVLTGEQFPSNVYSWLKLAQQRKAQIRTVSPLSVRQRGSAWNDALLEAIDERTAIVAVPHVHWTDGTRFDIQRVADRARSFGAALVVDATQSIGALPFDVQRTRPDALICAGYKWLLGPYSVAFAYFGTRFDDGEPLEENWISRENSEDFRGLVHYRAAYQPGALRYDVGERSNFALLPMAVAALKQIHEWQPARIQRYCADLFADAVEEIRALGFGVESKEWRASHLFGVRMPAGLDLAALHQDLQRAGISVALRGSAMRVAPNVYNDAADVKALVDTLRIFAETYAVRP